MRLTITDAQWRKLREADVEFARHTLLTMGHLQPMFIVMAPDGAQVIGAEMPDTGRDKDAVFAMVALLAAAEGAFAITFMAEAWMRTVPHLPGETDAQQHARAMQVPVAEAEDRQEILLISTTYRTEDGLRNSCTVLDIVRDMDGTAIAAPQRPDDPDAAADGRIAHLLRERPLTEPERGRARKAFDLLAKSAGFAVDRRHMHPPGHA